MNDEIEVLDITLPSLKKFYAVSKQDRIIAGYASVSVPDKVGDEFPPATLKEALINFMKREGGRWRNIMFGHQSVQIGEVLEQYKDSKGKVWETKVDDIGLFLVARITSENHTIANKVWDLIVEGELDSFSIMGVALDFKFENDGKPKKVITKLELYETTVCQAGMNPYAKFQVIKSMKLSECLPKLSKITVLPNCVRAVGSTVKFGEGNDFDLWLDPKLKKGLINEVAESIRGLFPKKQWDKLDQFADPSGPDGPALPVYNLVLEPTIHGHMQKEGDQSPSALTSKTMEEKKKLSEQLEAPAVEEKEDAAIEPTEKVEEKKEIKETKEEVKEKDEDAVIAALQSISEKLDALLDKAGRYQKPKPDGEKYPYGDKYPKPKDEEEKAPPPEDEEEDEEKAGQIDKGCGTRRGGKPRTEQERRTRHNRKYPGTKVPPRGTGLKRALKPDEEEDEEEKKELTEDELEKMITEKAEKKIEELLKDNPPEKRTKQPETGEPVKEDPVKKLLTMSNEELHKVDWREIDRVVKGEN